MGLLSDLLGDGDGAAGLSGNATSGLHTPIPAVGDYFTNHALARSSSVFAANRMYGMPFYCPEAMTIDRIGTELVTAAGTTATLRLGIYSHDTATQRPGALVLDAGTVDGTATTGAKEITVDQALPAGLLWLVAAPQGADAALPTWRSATTLPQQPTTAAPTGGTILGHRFVNSVSGALPDPATFTTGTTSNTPLIYLRRSA